MLVYLYIPCSGLEEKEIEVGKQLRVKLPALVACSCTWIDDLSAFSRYKKSQERNSPEGGDSQANETLRE